MLVLSPMFSVPSVIGAPRLMVCAPAKLLFRFAVSPAFQAVFSPFDAAIGHYRRYDRKELLALTPPPLKAAKSFYLDSLGLMLSVVNRFVTRRSSSGWRSRIPASGPRSACVAP